MGLLGREVHTRPRAGEDSRQPGSPEEVPTWMWTEVGEPTFHAVLQMGSQWPRDEKDLQGPHGEQRWAGSQRVPGLWCLNPGQKPQAHLTGEAGAQQQLGANSPGQPWPGRALVSWPQAQRGGQRASWRSLE